MLKKLVWLPAFLLLLAFGQSAMACGANEQGKAQCHCNKEHNWAAQLNLSPAQQTKLQKIRLQSRSNIIAKHEQMKKIRSQMLALTAKDKLDQTKLNALINQQKNLFASIIQLRMSYKNQVFNTLNTAQKIKFATLIEKSTDEGSGLTANAANRRS